MLLRTQKKTSYSTFVSFLRENLSRSISVFGLRHFTRFACLTQGASASTFPFQPNRVSPADTFAR